MVDEKVRDIIGIVDLHNKWRSECINLIASESVLSPLAQKYYLSDLAGRYSEHSGRECHYRGSKYSMSIEEECNKIFSNAFETGYVDVRPISGGVANLAVYYAFTRPGDSIISLGIPNGAHVSSTQWGLAGFGGLRSVNLAFNADDMNIDVDESLKIIRDNKHARIVMLGASMILFPEPVKELRQEIDRINPNIKIVYDAAHVFGLIYNKEFQEPLKEGADVITSSTHKTFQGPQGGIVIACKELGGDDWSRIQTAIFPGCVYNVHIHRFPALAITALEMNRFGKEYAKQLVCNAKSLGEALYNKGFNVLCPDKGFTESHQVIVNVKKEGNGKKVAEMLEASNIICNKMALPSDSPHDATKSPSGIRLGVQELTRYGMKEDDMSVIAEFFKKIINKQSPGKIREEVKEFRKEFQTIHYCFEDV